MALLLDYTTQSGIPLTQAYLKINSIKWEENTELEVRFDFGIFINEEHVIPVESNSYSFIYDLVSTDNVLTQCYNYLKTLERFTNISDYIPTVPEETPIVL